MKGFQNGTPLYHEMRSRGYVLKQNAPFRAIVKRDTPPGWTAIWAEGGNDLQGGFTLGHPYAVK